MNILISGGLGFLGTNLSIYFSKKLNNPNIFLVDSFYRKGTEYNYKILKGPHFHKHKFDLKNIPNFLKKIKFDFIICAASDPAVSAGTNNKISRLIENNITSTLSCLEIANENTKIIYISSSRVYSVDNLNKINIHINKEKSIYDLSLNRQNGLTKKGISEKFSCTNPGSFYGISKKTSEDFVKSFCSIKNIDYVILRPGILAGKYQFGMASQGILTFWLASHFFKQKLFYYGYEGMGYQTRDFLSAKDFSRKLLHIMQNFKQYKNNIFNIGGGNANKISLNNLTLACEKITGNSNLVSSRKNFTSPFDIPFFITDSSKIDRIFDFKKQSLEDLLNEIFIWLRNDQKKLKNFFKK